MDLWQTLITTAVGAFLGSGAAFGANLLAGRIGERRREAAALDELVHEIHFRRVLRRIEPRLSPNAAAIDPDYDKARHSASTLRGDIRRARRSLVSGSAAAPVLDTMTLACNTFLDESEAVPERYQLQLMQLQWRLAQAVHAVASTSPRVSDLEPGDAGLVPTTAGRAMPTEIGDAAL